MMGLAIFSKLTPMLGIVILLLSALALLLVILTAALVFEMRRPPRHTTAYALARGLPCDPGDLGLPFEEWQLDRPRAVSLPIWDIRTGENPKSKIQNPKSITAVFIHGWGHSRVDVLPRVESVKDCCERIILYDLRGHGDATGLSNLGFGETDDLLALLERLGDERIVLIGHSMGAVIAIRAIADATRRNDPIANRVAGIIAYGTYCGFHESLRGRLRVAGYPARPITDLALLAHRCLGLTPLSLRDSDIAAIRAPLLMIHGCEDRVSSIDHVRRWSTQRASITLHEIAGGAHSDTYRIDPNSHDEIVAAFLRNIQNDGARAV